MESEIGENEKAILKCEERDPFGYEWMFNVLRGKCRKPEGAPIVRIAKQLSEIERVIHPEFGLWMRNPAGV